MKYLMVCGWSRTDKNKLQTELKNRLRADDRKIFNDLGTVKGYLAEVSASSHNKHPRAAFINLSWNLLEEDGDYKLRNSGMGMDVDFFAFEPVLDRNADRSARTDCADEEFFIRTEGYSGNSLMWWRPNSRGYTSDLKQAGKYSKEKAEGICRGSGTELAYKASKVLGLPNGLFTTVHADYLRKDDADIDFRPHRLAKKEVSHGN